MDVPQVRENRRTWESIAESFDRTRTRAWRPVAEFIDALAPGSRVLDAGCGNGRHAALIAAAGHRLAGLDLSRSLLRLARLKTRSSSSQWIEGVVEELPFRSGQFDAALAVAVLHHVRGRTGRIATIGELLRVLRPEGRLLLSAWSRSQPRFGAGREPRRPADRPSSEPGDAWIRWTHDRLDVERFTHLYDWPEWNSEIRAAPARVERIWGEAILTRGAPDNYFAILRPATAPSTRKD